MHTQRLIYSWAIIGAVVSVLLVGCHRSSPSDLLHTEARGELDSGVWIHERSLEVHASPQVVLALLPHYGLPFNPDVIAAQQPISAGQEREDKRLRLLVAEQGFMLRHLQNQLAGMVYESPVSSRFFTSLTEVQKAYAGIHIRYYYGASETDNAAHLTRIQSRMQVSMSKHQLKAIAQSLAKAKQEFYGQIEGL